jgi:K(+)-stimulated pyrophosphate-energized sodium pump
LIGLVVAPILGGHALDTDSHDAELINEVEVVVKMKADDTDNAKAVVTSTTTVNGETVTEEKIIEGTTEVVKGKVEGLKEEVKNN